MCNLYLKKFVENIFLRNFEIASLPVESSFPETTWFVFWTTFDKASSCAPIASIIDSYSSSQ